MTHDEPGTGVPPEQADAPPPGASTPLSDLLRTERLATIELLESLTPAEWDTPSLCEGWTVRAVAAHVAWAPVTSAAQSMNGLARAGFRINRFIRDSAVRWSQRPTEELLAQLRTVAASGATPLGVPPIAALCDAVVHGLDIRRPLGRPRSVPGEPFTRLAEWQAGLRWPGTIMLGGSPQARIDGVRVFCDDVAWAHGAGPEVHGSSETLLLLLAGRRLGAGDLTGPGAPTVYARL